jgi:hypothetical protein
MIGPRKVDKPLVLYGYGKLGRLAEEIFKELNIPVHMIIDNALPTYFVLDPLDGAPLPRADVLVAVCVAKEPFFDVRMKLEMSGFRDIVPVWDIIEAYPQAGLHNGWFAGGISPVDQAGIKDVMASWSDFNSLGFYMSFLAWRKFHQEWQTVPMGSDYFVSNPMASKLQDIRDRQYKTEQFLVSGPGSVTVHCEGYELQTLQANITGIRKHRPKLDVACYHSRDGLWEIENYLMKNLPSYNFVFRLHAYMGQAAHMYCIPMGEKWSDVEVQRET